MTGDPTVDYINGVVVAIGFIYVLWFLHKYCVIRDEKNK